MHKIEQTDDDPGYCPVCFLAQEYYESDPGTWQCQACWCTWQWVGGKAESVMDEQGAPRPKAV